MKAIELVKSIIEFQNKKHYEKCLLKIKEKPEQECWPLLAKGYKSFESYIEMLKAEDNRKTSVWMSEKQANFLRSLMRNERIEKIIYNGYEIFPSNPIVPFSAYGGFIGKKADQSKHILRINKAY